MSRRGRRTGAAATSSVQGPTSALSSFLRERGINTGGRLSWRTGVRGAAATDQGADADANAQPPITAAAAEEQPVADPQSTPGILSGEDATVAPEAAEETVPPAQSVSFAAASTTRRRPEKKVAKKPPKKKKKKNSDGSDESDDDAAPVWSARSAFPRRDDAAMGKCQRCSQVLTMLNQSLCGYCLKLSTMVAAAKKKGKASRNNKSLMARPEDVCLVDGTRSNQVLSLQDMCIRLITRHIDQVEGFGAISENTREKLSLILSKHREINDNTLKLFLEDQCSTLHLFDCARLTNEAYEQVAYFGGCLTSLKLHECGQLRDSSVSLIARNLSQLRVLSLRGCFLVSDEALAEVVGIPTLQELRVEYSPKLGSAAVGSLSQPDTSLTSLSLVACSALTDDHMLKLRGLFGRLVHLDLSRCGGLVDCASLVTSLPPTLLTLRLDECFNGFSWEPCLPKLPKELQTLSLSRSSGIDIDLLTSQCPELTHLDVSRTLDPLIGLESLSRLPRLTHLNINGQKEITVALLSAVVPHLHQLEHVDVSWVQSFDDECMNMLLLANENLTTLHVWGCYMLTHFNTMVWERDRPALKLVGMVSV